MSGTDAGSSTHDLFVSFPSSHKVAQQHVLGTLEQQSGRGGGLTDIQLLELSLLYGNHLQKALPIVAAQHVTELVAEGSGRRLYKVQGSNGEQYLVLPSEYCSCRSFHNIVCKGEGGCCKHQIAAQISALLKACRTVSVSDEELAAHLFYTGTH